MRIAKLGFLAEDQEFETAVKNEVELGKVRSVPVCMLTLDQFVDGQAIYQVNCPKKCFFMCEALRERMNNDAAKTKIGQDLKCPRCKGIIKCN
jgi:hypothetical protein